MFLNRRALRPLIVAGLAFALTLLPTMPASASHSITVSSLTTSASTYPTTRPVKVTAQLFSSYSLMVPQLVIAVRNAVGANHDFPLQTNYQLPRGGRQLTQEKILPAGSYIYWIAYKPGRDWVNLSPSKQFQVTVASAPPSSDGSPAPKGPTGKWRYAFGDDFNGTQVDWQKWADWSSAETDNGHGNKNNQQLEWNHRKNCSVANGQLKITAKPDNITSSSGIHYNWSSCLLSSSPSYAFRYGYIEASAKFPKSRGFWPAFWTWQTAGNNQWTETDVYEYYSDNRTKIYMTQHSGVKGGCQITPSFDPSNGFHVYGADIKVTGTDFYIDGKKVCTAPGTSTGWTNIILDMFVYSRVPPVPGTVAVKQVDYVRAWRR